MEQPHDITIVGAGPVGLFGAYYAGFRGLRSKLVDSQPDLGGQVTALYPDKYIYDVAGFPKILGKDLVNNLVEQAMQRHPERLFVLRAHPDENRPGKEAQQSVARWVAASGVDRFPNVVFLGPLEQVSTYDLFRFGREVLVYNSSVGLEASIAGLPVLCAGRARYSQAGAAYLPGSRDSYREMLENWLSAGEVRPGQDHADRARRFLDFELFRASLDFSPFLRDRAGYPGMVTFLPFDPAALERVPDLEVIVRGIVDGSPFVRPEAEPATLTV